MAHLLRYLSIVLLACLLVSMASAQQPAPDAGDPPQRLQPGGGDPLGGVLWPWAAQPADDRLFRFHRRERPEEPPAKRLKARQNKLPEEAPGPMELRLPEEDQEMATKLPGMLPNTPHRQKIDSPSSKEESKLFIESVAIATWNHSIAVGLLQASFEICQSAR